MNSKTAPKVGAAVTVRCIRCYAQVTLDVRSDAPPVCDDQDCCAMRRQLLRRRGGDIR